jgi:hypothetical protein
VWRKIRPKEVKEAEIQLVRTTFDMVRAEQYQLAIKILEFATKPPMKFSSTEDRLICLVNLARSYKWLGNEEKCIQLLDAEDWSAARVDFRIAESVLRNDFAKAAKLMRAMGPKGEITKGDFENWPLFKKFREDKTFSDAYREIFKTDMVAVPANLELLLEQDKQPKRLATSDAEDVSVE